MNVSHCSQPQGLRMWSPGKPHGQEGGGGGVSRSEGRKVEDYQTVLWDLNRLPKAIHFSFQCKPVRGAHTSYMHLAIYATFFDRGLVKVLCGGLVLSTMQLQFRCYAVAQIDRGLNICDLFLPVVDSSLLPLSYWLEATVQFPEINKKRTFNAIFRDLVQRFSLDISFLQRGLVHGYANSRSRICEFTVMNLQHRSLHLQTKRKSKKDPEEPNQTNTVKLALICVRVSPY